MSSADRLFPNHSMVNRHNRGGLGQAASDRTTSSRRMRIDRLCSVGLVTVDFLKFEDFDVLRRHRLTQHRAIWICRSPHITVESAQNKGIRRVGHSWHCRTDVILFVQSLRSEDGHESLYFGQPRNRADIGEYLHSSRLLQISC